MTRDLRHALRRLLRDWPFTVAAIVILGLGIGANTAVFSVVNAALLRAPSFQDADRLVDIFQNESNPGGVDGNSYPAYLDMAEYTGVFADVTAVLVPRGVRYQHEGGLRPATVEHTTATYPSVLRLRPALGRWFTAEEDTAGAAVVAVLGHRTWTRKFGADPSVIGRTIRIEGVPVTIVGVGPAGYNSTFNIGIVTDFWLPISSLPVLGAPPRVLERRPEEAAFLVKARLKDGVTLAQAQAVMRMLATRLASQYPTEDPGKGISVFATNDIRVHPQVDTLLRSIGIVLLGVVGLVLALACSNLATLLLVRGAARAKDVSVRLALGATRTQLVRHLLMESLLLSAAGGLAGCILADWTVALIGTLDVPIVVDLSLDYRVLTFAVGLSVLTGVAFGFAPALKATRIDLAAMLHGDAEARSTHGRWLTLKNALVVFQVAASVVLLGGTGLFLQMLNAARAQRVGFAVDGVAMIETDARYAGYSTMQARNVAEEIRRRVASIPAVRSAALTRGLPMQVTGLRLVIANGDGPTIRAGAIWAGPGYFETLGIPILHGRAIDERDRRGTTRAAVVSEAMAREYFGTSNAVGRRFRLEQDVDDWFEIVGVARNSGTANLSSDLLDPTPHLFYRSFIQADVPADTVIGRTTLDALGLVADMQREIRATDSALPVISATTMAQYLEDSLLVPSAAVTVLGTLGALGLGLAAIGLYAIVAFRVSRRVREIGIRMALGARRAHVVRTVTTEVAVLLGFGTGGGLLLSLLAVAALRAVSSPAPGVTLYRPTTDPVMLMAIAAIMGGVGLAAASVPAWRAARMDPLTALRHD